MNTHDDDTDPTGMRALLRGLPDPGPMPDDLVTRIQASLADLPALDGASPADPLEHDAATVSRGTSAGSRHSWWSRHASHAAVAAVVLVGGGAAFSGGFGLLGSGSDLSGSASSGASDSSQGQPNTYAEADPDSAKPPLAQAAREGVPGGISIRQSGRAYSADSLASQVSPGPAGSTLAPLTAESPAIGPIGTETGVRSCLEALGLPGTLAADVDLGSVDGTPAAVVVVTLAGGRTAYAVGRDCTTGNPSLLAGPTLLP